MLDVTIEHLEQLKRMCASEVTDSLLDYCLESCQILCCYGAMGSVPGDWCLCRQQLLASFPREECGSPYSYRAPPRAGRHFKTGAWWSFDERRSTLNKTHPLARNYLQGNGSQHARKLGGNMYAEPLPEAKEIS